MTPKVIVYLIATTLLVAGCSSSGDFTSTWYDYLNPGQTPTITNLVDYHNSYGFYPTLTDEQYRYINNELRALNKK